MANLETLELTINANAESASRGLTNLINSLTQLSAKIQDAFTKMHSLNSEIQTLNRNGNMSKLNLPDVGGKTGAKSVSRSRSKFKLPTQEDYAALRQISKLQMVNGQPAYVAPEFKDAKIVASFDGFKKSAEETKEVTKEASEKSKGFFERLKDVGKGLQDQVPKFKMLNRVMRIFSTMLIRMGIRALFKGAKEGFNNFYQYSKAVGSTFYQEMDKVYSSWNQIKNQMGAAIAPAISAAIPVLNSLTSAAITAFNAFSQLLALLSGKSSWTKATEVVSEYGDAIGSAAGGGSDKIKEMLASFDELNVIASESGGGGGGGGNAMASEFTDMFEEMYVFDEKIRDLVKWLKSNLTSIKGIAIAIGTAIGAWKLANAFATALPVLSKLAGLASAGAVIAVTLQLTWLLTNRYLDTKDPGWLIADVFTTAVGSTAAAAIAKKFIGGKAGAYTMAIALTFSAVTGIKAVLGNANVGALSKESIVALVENALKVGAAGAILMHSVGGAKIGTSLIGGAAVAITTFAVAIGLKTALDPNVKIFSAQSIITSVTSALVAGLGLTLISGSLVFGAGAAIASILAYFAIKANVRQKDVTWGTVELSEKEVERFVNQKMYSIEVHTVVERIETQISENAINKDRLADALSQMLGTLRIINLGISNKQDWKQLKAEVSAVVTIAQQLVEDARNHGKLTLQFTPTLVGKDDQEQGDWFTNYTQGWDKVDQWFASKGEELGALFVENEKGEIIASKPDLIKEISQQIADVTNAMLQGQMTGAAFANFSIGLGDLTEKSAKEVLKQFKKYKEELTQGYTNLVNEQYAKQKALVDMLFTIDPNSDAYKKAYADLIKMGKNLSKAVEDGVASAIEPGKNLVLEWIIGKKGNLTLSDSDMNFFVETATADLAKAMQFLKDRVNSNFSKEELEIMDLVGITGFDLLSVDMQKKLVKALAFKSDTLKQLKEKLGLDASKVIALSGFDKLTEKERKNLATALFNAYGSKSAIAGLKTAIPNISVGGIIAMTDWKSFTATQKSEFIAALVNAFGAKAALAAAKKAGIDITAEINNGFKSGSDKVKESARKVKEFLDKLMGKKTTTGDVTTPPNFGKPAKDAHGKKHEEFQKTVGKDVVTGDIKAKKDLGQSAEKEFKDEINSVEKMAKNANTVLPNPTFGSDMKGSLSKQLKDAYEAAKSSVSGGIQIKVGLVSNGGSISASTSFSGGLPKITLPHVRMYASGGMPDAGDIFIANERSAELVGSLNGRPAVANQDQIVAGIQKGVSDANQEQNSLLRQQNELLRAILAKDTGIRPSSALGRTVRQSLNMYNAVTGG